MHLAIAFTRRHVRPKMRFLAHSRRVAARKHACEFAEEVENTDS